jgi:hypothetical protein
MTADREGQGQRAAGLKGYIMTIKARNRRPAERRQFELRQESSGRHFGAQAIGKQPNVTQNKPSMALVYYLNHAMLDQAESIGLQPVAERAADGGPVLDEDESVLQKFERLQLVVGPSIDQGEGALFITEW